MTAAHDIDWPRLAQRLNHDPPRRAARVAGDVYPYPDGRGHTCRAPFRLIRSVWAGDVDGAFEQFALVEHCPGTDQGDQVWGVDGPPASLCGINELVGHGNPGSAGLLW